MLTVHGYLPIQSRVKTQHIKEIEIATDKNM